MNKKQLQLARQREYLVAKASSQRTTLAESIEPWRRPLALADQGLNALRYIKRHPEWLAGVAVLFAALRPRSAGKWLGRGLMTWKLMHNPRGRSS
ncbi:MAG TPA: YqjK-like family protein [Gammaproteobacteria bacterium]|nr:YqjK-like family protein [Gammaproteobacteria bacterium]